MNQDTQHKIISSVLTALCMFLLFLLLWFVYLTAPIEEEEEGVEVAFGVVEQAGGYESRESQAVPVPAQSTPPPPASTPSQNDLLTQEDEEALQLARQREEEKKRQRELEEAERAEQARLQAEAEAKAKAKAEAEAKALAEKQAKEAQAIANANALGSLFGNNGSNAAGSGDSKGTGQKGNPVGKGSIGGNDWSLANRGLVSLPKPGQDFNQAGIVVVQIMVDANGNVVSAQVGKGTNISDEYTRQMAVKAAYKAKFSATDRPDKQFGTITYKFQYN